MATDSKVATSVDVLSSSERKLVVEALTLKGASLRRAAKSATNAVVSEAYEAEASTIDALSLKFR